MPVRNWLTVVTLLQPVIAIPLIDGTAALAADHQWPLSGSPNAFSCAAGQPQFVSGGNRPISDTRYPEFVAPKLPLARDPSNDFVRLSSYLDRFKISC